MTVTNSIELKNYITHKKTAVALGSFDALHKGHIKVIKGCIDYARKKGLLAVVQLVEIPNSKRVNTSEKRLGILEDLGADIAVIEEFSPEFKNVRYDEFVREYLAGRYNAAAVFSGDNYRFGYMAEGDTQKLKTECKRFGIEVFVSDCVQLEGVISSTEIRRFIENGDMEKAAQYMGRPVSLSGRVVHGKALGRKLGFPTANVEIPGGFVVPQRGVYAAVVVLDGKRYYSVANVGTKPTVNDKKPNIEAYMFGFNDEIYGDEIEIEFRKKLRDIKKFESTAELSRQIEKDKQAAEEYFEI